MIALKPHERGVAIPVRAQPGARRNAVTGEHDGALKVAVSAAPEKGKANAAIIKVLAEALGCGPSQLEILAGETSRRKSFLLTGLPLEEVSRRLQALTGQGTPR